MLNVDHASRRQWDNHKIPGFVHPHYVTRVSSNKLRRRGNSHAWLGSSDLATTRLCCLLGQSGKACAYVVSIVASQHVDHLHLHTERLDVGGRHVAQDWALAECTTHASVGVNAMCCQGEQRLAWVMPVRVEPGDD